MLRHSLLLVPALLAFSCGGPDAAAPDAHTVQRGTVTQDALAVGRIMPRVQVPVHSPWGGVVTNRPVKVGDRVTAGAKLLEVRPQLTDRDRLDARRQLQGAQEGLEEAVEISDGKNLLGQAMRLVQGRGSLDRMRAGAERSRRATETQLSLLLEGEAQEEGLVLDWFLRAPIAGTVVELPVELGQPITPGSTFGSGTLLMTIADLDRPVFRGTVDELDAGRLSAGMKASVDLGALPSVPVKGTLREISLIAGTKNDAAVFDVTLDVTPPLGATLRAGYSAVARIAVARAVDVLVLPERFVDYRTERGVLTAFVCTGSDPDSGELTWQQIEAGVSDGLIVEVVAGLNEGDTILELPR